jgi:hypothetical protein
MPDGRSGLSASAVSPGASALNPRVFISIDDRGAAAYAQLLYERLNRRFTESIFLDVRQIQPGDDFVEIITSKVSSCDVLVALIDREWISVKSDDGRRLDDPNDFVRLEIATALERGIRVIPALLNGAPMPTSDQLPESLRGLARRQALQMVDSDLDHHANLLIEAVERELSLRAGGPENSITNSSGSSAGFRKLLKSCRLVRVVTGQFLGELGINGAVSCP